MKVCGEAALLNGDMMLPLSVCKEGEGSREKTAKPPGKRQDIVPLVFSSRMKITVSRHDDHFFLSLFF